MTATPQAARTGPTAAEVSVPDRAALAAADHGQRTTMLDTYVRQELGRVLGIPPQSVDTTNRPMSSLGVGSIAGLELQRQMETALQVELNLQMLLLANSAAELVDCLADQLAPVRIPHRSASGAVA
ncbi:acyl carrier protein [Streptomyces sp. NBC_00237]|uniref:acyl carrier protein n=1 Tax=Streptomyces sp. NBC_00237 TaxID=2975687 RepID=UPI00225B94E7|nr:acyl carrier protein [Streptomyces sp. NBC_00237]MCX5203238.1 acyl carrier protein [Streptomyces sp. NBC_00237]